MEDAYAQFTTGLESPAVRALEITPDDGTDLSEFSRALNVATSGTVRITTLEDNIVTLFVAAGIAFPIRVRRVWATGTTAGGIVALY
ncbi:MAG: spike base protein, RCAP_Rcc01079 family [Phaeobacter italicus]